MNRCTQEVFLANASQKAWDRYQQTMSDGSFPVWDYVIITASNKQQAISFWAQLEERRANGFLPNAIHFGVVPDPEGERVGNGGAMLGAMRYVAEHSGRSDFRNLKTMVLLSSGDSRRVPQYSAMGKVFSPVPRELPNGRPSTLFDEMMMTMIGVPQKTNHGMLILSGDVMLAFDSDQIPDNLDEAFAIAFPEPAKMGANHGVFLNNEYGYIAKVWHKQKAEVLGSYGAVDNEGCVNIDTGAVFFTAKMLENLYRLICNDKGQCTQESFHQIVNNEIAPSLYVDFFYPLAAESTFDGYMAEKPEGHMSSELIKMRESVWHILRPFRIRLLRLELSRFIHFGATSDIVELMSKGIEKYKYLSWKKQVRSVVNNPNIAAYNSILADDALCGENVYLENCYVGPGCRIGANSIISNVFIENTYIPEKVVIHGLKQKNGKHIVRIYGIEDDPKSIYEENALLFGKPLHQAFGNQLVPVLWRSDTIHSLWTAELYEECDSEEEAIRSSLNLYHMYNNYITAESWRGKKRKSLCSSFNDAADIINSLLAGKNEQPEINIRGESK